MTLGGTYFDRRRTELKQGRLVWLVLKKLGFNVNSNRFAEAA